MVRIFLFLSIFIAPWALAQEGGEGSVDAPQDTATQWFKEADRVYEYAKVARDNYEKQRAFRAAAPLFERFENRFPSHPDAAKALYRAGVCYLLTGRRESAEKKFVEALYKTGRKGQIAAASAFRLGSLAYNDKYFKTALPHFTLTASQTDKPTLRQQALNYKARCLLLSDRTSEAAVILRQLVRDPHEPNKFKNSARLALAHISATSGKLEEAYKLYLELAKLESFDPEVLTIKAQAIVHGGMAALRLGETETGLEMLNNALRTPGLPDDSKAEAQLTLMQHEFIQENYDEVMNLFRRGSSFKQARPETTANILMFAGRSAAKLGQHNTAIEMFLGVDRTRPNTKLAFEASYRRLLSFYALRGTNLPDLVNSFVELYKGKYPKNPWIQQARLMKAETYFSYADYDSATKAWERVNFARLPENLRGPAIFKSGWCLVENGDYNSAIAQLSEFIARYPESDDLYAALAKRAQSYLSVGDRISAIADTQRILENKPNTALAAFALQLSGRLYRLEGRHEKVIESYQTLLKDYDNLSQDTIARAHYRMGVSHFEEGNFEEAIEELTLARKLVPEFYEESAGTYAAMSHYRLKQPEEVRQNVSRLFAINPRKTLPRRLLSWLGLQMYEKSNFSAADYYLTMIAASSTPENTELGIWKALAKSRLELAGQESRSLEALNHILANEDDPFWRADAFLDKANAHLKLRQWDDAEIAALQGLNLDPQGTIKSGLHLILGDLSLARENYSEAASEYVRASEMFLNDANVQPEALHKAALCYQKLDDLTAASAFEKRLRIAHPNWQAPSQLNVTPGAALKPTSPPPAPQTTLPQGVTPVSALKP